VGRTLRRPIESSEDLLVRGERPYTVRKQNEPRRLCCQELLRNLVAFQLVTWGTLAGTNETIKKQGPAILRHSSRPSPNVNPLITQYRLPSQGEEYGFDPR